jgi:hypothetical protein
MSSYTFDELVGYIRKLEKRIDILEVRNDIFTKTIDILVERCHILEKTSHEKENSSLPPSVKCGCGKILFRMDMDKHSEDCEFVLLMQDYHQ